MYCPKCGLQQANAQVRFCTRCGFQLEVVSGLLAGDGAAEIDARHLVQGRESHRRKGMKRGAKLIFIAIVLSPIFFFASIQGDTPAPLVVPFTVFLAGLAWLLYSSLFSEEETAPRRPKPELEERLSKLVSAPRSGIAGVADRRDPAEKNQAPSVTERTTRLFPEDQQE